MLIDLHVHTTAYSACSEMSPDQMMIAAKDIGLDGVCLTEHDKIWDTGSVEALAQKYGLVVLRGMEVTTTGGDILVFGLEDAPEGMWTPEELKSKVDQAGGVAIAAHPFRGFLLFGFTSMSADMDEAAKNPTFSQVHGMEICNGNVTDDENEYARKVSEKLGLLQVGGSDAHTASKIGKCVTRFQDRIRNESELIAGLKAGRFSVDRLI
jgi:hypothetical protein